MVPAQDLSDPLRQEGPSLLGAQDPLALHLWVVPQEEAIPISHHRASLLVGLNLAFHRALRLAMDLDIRFQVPSLRMA